MMSNSSHPKNYMNAQKSTGPRTQRGKARSSQNARKHGIRSPISSDQRWRLELITLCAAVRDQTRSPLDAPLLDECAYALVDLNRISEAIRLQFEAAFKDIAVGLPIKFSTLLVTIERLKRYEQRAHYRFTRIFEKVVPGHGSPPSRKQSLPQFRMQSRPQHSQFIASPKSKRD